MLRQLASRIVRAAAPAQSRPVGVGALLGFTGAVGLAEVALADEAEHGCARAAAAAAPAAPAVAPAAR